MANLAIKGHTTRGKEVIDILEMLDGKNEYQVTAIRENRVYFVDEYKNINFLKINQLLPEHFIVFTLEEFLEKYPYKVGDKVKCWIDGYRSVANIKDIHWDSISNKIKYKIGDYWHDALNLEPFKEEIVDEMNKAVFEGTMEEKPVNHVYDVDVISFDIAQKDIYELDLKDKFHVILRKGKYYVERIKPKYPKTYEECCEIKHCDRDFYVDTHLYSDQLGLLYKLLICRDAYWKMAGEQMGLNETWKPDFTNDDEVRYGMYTAANKVVKDFCGVGDVNTILTFPTEEMRDAFYENFKELIEACKEIL